MNDADKQARGSRIGERLAVMQCNCGKTFLDRDEASDHARQCDEMPHINEADT